MTVIVVVTSTMAGYALAKIPFRGRGFVFGALLSGLMIPWEITIIPLYIIIVRIGWVNTSSGCDLADVRDPARDLHHAAVFAFDPERVDRRGPGQWCL